MAVSELEKYADNKIRKARIPSRIPRELSFTVICDPE